MADLKQLVSDQRVCCPHCKEQLSTKTFARHKRLYFDEERHTWFTNQDEEEFDLPERFSDDDEGQWLSEDSFEPDSLSDILYR